MILMLPCEQRNFEKSIFVFLGFLLKLKISVSNKTRHKLACSRLSVSMDDRI